MSPKSHSAPGAGGATSGSTPRRLRARGGRRSDAERNIAAILDAGLEVFGRDPNATVAEVARAAGVGRVTLYGHFPSREDLLEAVVAHAVVRADQAQATEEWVAAEVPATEAISRLMESSWRILDRYRRLAEAGRRALPAERVRRYHSQIEARAKHLIARGRETGEFRTDLPLEWLVATFYSVLHAAAEEVDAGRLAEDEAARVLTATLLSVLKGDPAAFPGECPS